MRTRKHYRFKQLAYKLGDGGKVNWLLSTKYVDNPVCQCPRAVRH